MKVIEAGHIYELDCIPFEPNMTKPDSIRLVFVNREDNKHAGTQTQEVLRALIDRTMHCDNCLRWPSNDRIIFHLRMALALHESRAIERKTQKGLIKPEIIICGNDGHFDLDYTINNSADEIEYEKRREET